MRSIQDGPPVITSVTQNDEPGFEARVLCLVDGFPAEIQHVINTKRQEYNRHELSIFEPTGWKSILNWGFVEAGHVPTYPEEETSGYLSGLSQTMWGMANVVVRQGRLRREDLDVAQYAAERMEYQRQLSAFHEMRAAAQRREDDFPAVEHGEIVVPVPNGWYEPPVMEESFGPANDEVAARVLADAEPEAPYTGTEPEDQG